MKSERWQQVNELFRAALERAAGERAAFLDRACAGDPELHREVASLVASYEEEDSFLETPAVAGAARALLGDQAESLAGHMIGHYRVVSLIGKGGMGEVYLAEDTRLGRKVALKLLPGYMSQDADRLRRFAREARAASALSDPNVCTIYELGETEEGRRYIVMEYVEGLTLRQRLSESRMELSEVVEVSIQIAAALAAAHNVGVVHRDIKPENVMLRRDGIVKVLDFGLAKLTEQETVALPHTLTRLNTQTEAGVVLGTVAYMSPEQARGLAVDARTDVWSLGCVLYEMVAGRVPFAGATNSDVIAALLEREPPPLARSSSQVTVKLQHIVSQALRKERQERYQTAKELFTDLKVLRRELETADEIDHSGRTVMDHTTGSAPRRARPLGSWPFSLESARRRIFFLIALVGALLIAGFISAHLLSRGRAPGPQTEIRSLAVLPFKSLEREARDDYIGLGIADTIIMKVSQVGGLVVRPTSAVRRYTSRESDALEAARELQVDAVLDGTFLHADDRLRVSVNLLRVRDGASLWAETFDMRYTDILAIQDKVSQEVAARLRQRLNAAEQALLAKRQTTNIEAHTYYTKAMYHFSKRGVSGERQEETEIAIDLFRKAIELDPNYALAHAQLGFAYAWMADFEEKGPDLIARAKEELRVAERLDPQLAEVHVARSFIFSGYDEDWQLEAAAREARLAKQLNPNLDNLELAVLYYHIGLEEQAATEFEQGLERDPTSEIVKRRYLNMYILTARPDEWMALHQRLFHGGDAHDWLGSLLYYLEKRMLREAAPLIEKESAKNPAAPEARRHRALMLALQGQYGEAEAAVPGILERVRRDRAYHHTTYDIARIYALDGKSAEALKWLRLTSQTGFPCYPLFARDSFLDPIRKDPAFMQFMNEMKTRWEGYRREFG